MKKIDVSVKENASIAEIAAKIAASLSKTKQLTDKSSNQKLIGSGAIVEVIDNEIQINVTRELGKFDELVTCHCGAQYMESAGFKYKTNYGGTTRQKTVCTEDCFNVVQAICGNRVAKMRQHLPCLVKIPDFIGETAIKIHEQTGNEISFKKTGSIVQFFKGGNPFVPTANDLKNIYNVLKLVK